MFSVKRGTFDAGNNASLFNLKIVNFFYFQNNFRGGAGGGGRVGMEDVIMSNDTLSKIAKMTLIYLTNVNSNSGLQKKII
jgi:hypothetical protein